MVQGRMSRMNALSMVYQAEVFSAVRVRMLVSQVTTGPPSTCRHRELFAACLPLGAGNSLRYIFRAMGVVLPT